MFTSNAGEGKRLPSRSLGMIEASASIVGDLSRRACYVRNVGVVSVFVHAPFSPFY